MPKSYVFYVTGMHCNSCSQSIETALKASLDIKIFHTDVTTADPKKITVILEDVHNEPTEHKEKWLRMKGIITKSGFKCKDYDYSPQQKIIKHVPTNPVTSTTQYNKETEYSLLQELLEYAKNRSDSHWLLGALGCVSGIALLILMLTMGSLPVSVMVPIAGISSLLTLWLGANSYYDSWIKWTKTGTLTMDALFTISTLSVLTVSITSFFIPWLPMMFEAGLLIYGFRHIGLAIQDSIKEKINPVRFQDRAPKIARKYTSKGLEDINLEDIAPDDTLLIAPGDIIPVDGICLTDSSIYNTIDTGAILPRNYKARESVLSGMKLAPYAAPLTLIATKSAQDSFLARYDDHIEHSLLKKAPLEIKTQSVLTYFIPSVLALSALSGLVVGIFFPPALAIQCAISVLVSACPCTLGLIIPLAVKTGMHKAANHGVQFKNAKRLQQMEQIDTVVFDLNGTLTTGIPVVKNYTVLNSGMTPAHFLSLCYTLEADTSHPVGKAIYTFADTSEDSKFLSGLSINAHPSGVEAQLNNKSYLIGSATLLQEHGLSTAEIEKGLQLDVGDSLVFLAEENKIIGYVTVTDPLRADALQTIKALQAMNKEIHLCTGAAEKTAQRYAAALHIKHIHAGFRAMNKENKKGKPDYIQSLKAQGHKVAMVGDSANDAGALAASDIGVAIMSQNSDELTQKHASLIIHNGALLPITKAFAVSSQTVTNIKQNLFMSLGYNIAAVLIAGGLLVGIGFVLNPGIGVALMALQACLILLNVDRFKHQSFDLPEEDSDIKQEPVASSYGTIKLHTPACLPKHSRDTHPLDVPLPAKKQPEYWPSFWSCNSFKNEDAEEANTALQL